MTPAACALRPSQVGEEEEGTVKTPSTPTYSRHCSGPPSFLVYLFFFPLNHTTNIHFSCTDHVHTRSAVALLPSSSQQASANGADSVWNIHIPLTTVGPTGAAEAAAKEHRVGTRIHAHIYVMHVCGHRHTGTPKHTQLTHSHVSPT